MMLPVLGIDVSKRKFDVALIAQGKVKNKVCSNSPQGFQELHSWLAKQGVQQVHACMEATGTYGEALATFLVDAGMTVSMVNPACIRGYAQSELTRTKTDKVDAALIARFCEVRRPAAWTPDPQEVRELRSLVRRLSELQEMQRMELNRIEAGTASKDVQRQLEAHVSQLDDQIKETGDLIKRQMNNHPDLKGQKDLLTSIPGIGDLTAAALLGEIGDFNAFESPRQLVAYCGLDPRERRSGSSVRGKPHLSKVGNARVRKALYMPAIVAWRWNPVVQELCERLVAKGKAKMVAVGAAMRKLLHLAFGVLKNKRPFDPQIARPSLLPS